MAPTNVYKKDEMINYLLLVMKNAHFKPDYHQLAQEAGLLNANAAQKRFKRFVELNGFGLVGGAVVGPGGSADSPATPAKAGVRSKKFAATPTSAEKRKMKATIPKEEFEEEEDIT